MLSSTVARTTGPEIGADPSERSDGAQKYNDRERKSSCTFAAGDPEGVLLASASFCGQSDVSGDTAATDDPAGTLFASSSFGSRSCFSGGKPAAIDPAGVLLASASFCSDGRESSVSERNTHDGGWQQKVAREVSGAPADESCSIGGDAFENDADARSHETEELWQTLPEETLRALAEDALHAIVEENEVDETEESSAFENCEETGSAASEQSHDCPASQGTALKLVAESHSFCSASTEVISNRSRPGNAADGRRPRDGRGHKPRRWRGGSHDASAAAPEGRHAHPLWRDRVHRQNQAV